MADVQLTYIQDLAAASSLSPDDLLLLHQSGSEKSLSYAALLSSLSLGTASKRDVGTASNQIPDMSFFSSSYGICRLPSGVKIQVMTTNSAVGGRVTVNFNVAFTTSCWMLIPVDTSETPAGVIGWGYAPGSVTLTSATLFNSNSSTESCKVLAIGI